MIQLFLMNIKSKVCFHDNDVTLDNYFINELYPSDLLYAFSSIRILLIILKTINLISHFSF